MNDDSIADCDNDRCCVVWMILAGDHVGDGGLRCRQERTFQDADYTDQGSVSRAAHQCRRPTAVQRRGATATQRTESRTPSKPPSQQRHGSLGRRRVATDTVAVQTGRQGQEGPQARQRSSQVFGRPLLSYGCSYKASCTRPG